MAHPLVDGVAYTGEVAQKQLYGEGDTAMGCAAYRLLYDGAIWAVAGFGSAQSPGDIATNWNGTNKVIELDWSALTITFITQPALIAVGELNVSTYAARYMPQGKALSVSTGEIAFFDDTHSLVTTEDTAMACLFFLIGEIG